MMKTLNPSNTSALVDRIRGTRSRRITLRQPRFEHVDGKATVLSLASGNNVLGEFRTKTRQEAQKIAQSQQVNLSIGWDSNRNETVIADFA
jgi:hypothetical protein